MISQETLRRLTLADEHFVEDLAWLGRRLAAISALDTTTVALLQLRTPVVLSPLTASQERTARGGAGGRLQPVPRPPGDPADDPRTEGWS